LILVEGQLVSVVGCIDFGSGVYLFWPLGVLILVAGQLVSVVGCIDFGSGAVGVGGGVNCLGLMTSRGVFYSW
jgi:hypothetical protein